LVTNYSNEFLLKIETGLSLECDMSLFFSGSHKCLKYLTKTVSPINLNIFLDSQYFKMNNRLIIARMVSRPDCPKICSKERSLNITSIHRISFVNSVGEAVKLIFENIFYNGFYGGSVDFKN
jgi:hypothetical protein